MLLPFVEQFISFTFDTGQASKRENNKHLLGKRLCKESIIETIRRNFRGSFQTHCDDLSNTFLLF